MKIIVCIKQVPDLNGPVAVGPDGVLNRGAMGAAVNPEDWHALEAALVLKEREGCQVLALSMGPESAAGLLWEALALGADQAFLVTGREFVGSDTFATAQILAAAIDIIGLGREDIILCGRQAIDGDTAQVGPELAARLGLPQGAYAARISLAGERVELLRAEEDGGFTRLSLPRPCLLTCLSQLNQPRYMRLDGLLAAEHKPLTRLGLAELRRSPLFLEDSIGAAGSPTHILASFSPPPQAKGVILEDGEEAYRLVAREIAALCLKPSEEGREL